MIKRIVLTVKQKLWLTINSYNLIIGLGGGGFDNKIRRTVWDRNTDCV